MTTTARTAPYVLQPILVTLVVAAVSGLAVVALVRGVLATAGGLPLAGAVLTVGTVILAVALGLLFRRLRARSHWVAAVVIALVVLLVFAALLVTGTERFSIVTLRPEVAIVAVALAAGASSALLLPGRWRILGAAGVIGFAWLALTPVLVAI